MGVDGTFCRIRFENFSNLKLDTKRCENVDAISEEGKRFEYQIHLDVISRDC